MELTEQIQVMASEVVTLRQLLGQVVASQPFISVDGGNIGSAAAARGFMAQMQQQISQLDADRALVFAGIKSFDGWWSLAKDYENALQSQVGEAATYAFGNTLAEGAAATMGEVGQDAAQVAAAAKSGTTWGVLAFVAVALVAWRLA